MKPFLPAALVAMLLTVAATAVSPAFAATITDADLKRDTAMLASDAFEGSPPDIVITVCDRAAGEACPIFFGPALKAHWGLADPSDASGSEAEITAAFETTLAKIHERVSAFLALPLKTISAEQLKAELNRIGSL